MSSKSIFYIITLSTLFFTSPAWSSRICYFSLNNQKEFEEMDKFTKKLNTVSKTPIEIQEFQTEGSDIKQSFEAMVKSGAKCDGLVISGHHTGSFGGKRGNGQLDISFMEELSCKDEYKGFFENVKALWLQGCRTLGVGKIEANDTADMHTDRVGAVLAEDNLTQSFAQLNMEFSSTLDQDNPLSSRYLRVFPRANTFGWTKTAPGEKAKSEFSIPYHIAHIAHLNDDRGRYFDNPVGEQIDSKDLATYVSAFNKLFATPECPQCEATKLGNKKTAKDIVLEAWMEQGDGSKKYALANSDLNAYPSIYKSNDELLKKAKEIECFMKNSDDHKKIAEVITEALKSDAMIGRSFHSIYEYMQRLKKEGKFAELDELNKKLKESPVLQNFLMKKFASKELGVLRKIDYYAFWKDMTGQQVEGIEKQLNEYLFEIVTKENPNNDQNQIDFVNTVFQSLSKNNLLKSDALMGMVVSDKANAITFISVTNAIRDAKSPIDRGAEVLAKIISLDKANADTLVAVANAIRNANSPIPGGAEVLAKIISLDKANTDTLVAVANAIGNANSPIASGAEMLAKIISLDKANTDTLVAVANAIGNANSPIASGAEMLAKIISLDKANANTLSAVADAIGNANSPIAGGAEMLAKIISLEKANAQTLGIVTYAIKNATSPIPNAKELLALVEKRKAELQK
jgi:hypothetical protein